MCFPRRQPWEYATDLHHSSVNNSKHSANSKCSASVFSKEFGCVYNSGVKNGYSTKHLKKFKYSMYKTQNFLDHTYSLDGIICGSLKGICTTVQQNKMHCQYSSI